MPRGSVQSGTRARAREVGDGGRLDRLARLASDSRDRGRARHGEPTHVSDADDTPDSAVAAAPEATFDVASLPCVDDFEAPPERPDVPTRARDRARSRPAAVEAASQGMEDLRAALAEAAEFRRSGGLAAAHAEVMDIGREYLARGGTLVNNAANRRILAEITRERKRSVTMLRGSVRSGTRPREGSRRRVAGWTDLHDLHRTRV